MRLSVLLIAALALLAADSDFNGRWDLSVPGESKGRVWWLEVSGAGTSAIKGRFVGFPGGDMNDIPQISIANNELHFSDKSGHLEYTARIEGGKLAGTFHGNNGNTLNFTGDRAPVITEKDDGSWREGKPVELFNGKDLTGWNEAKGWTVENGILHSTGGAANLETARKFWNFALRVEYRVGPHSNSGVGLRGRYEVQILDDFGAPPQSHGNGALYSRIAPAVNASRPPGEWQAFDIRLVGRIVSVTLNGQKLIDKREIEGLTAIANNAREAEPGAILLQGDHGPVDFRRLVLTPLTKP